MALLTDRGVDGGGSENLGRLRQRGGETEKAGEDGGREESGESFHYEGGLWECLSDEGMDGRCLFWAMGVGQEGMGGTLDEKRIPNHSRIRRRKLPNIPNFFTQNIDKSKRADSARRRRAQKKRGPCGPRQNHTITP